MIRRILYNAVGHPLVLNSSRHWWRLVRSSGGIDRRYRSRAWQITMLSPLTAPFRLAEQAYYWRNVRAVEMPHDPIFVIGHWRTGTTYLHNLLAQDPALGVVPTFQTLAPDSFLIGNATLKPLIAFIMPRKRHTDNVPLAADSPQEEEFALCNLCPYSLYAGWYFPRRMPELFRKYVLFRDVPAKEVDDWKRVYIKLLKKACYNAQGRRLVLKNPANTGRVPILLEMFPNAKFVHIYRDPYVVYKSTQLLHKSTLDMIALQDIGDAEIRDNVLMFFKEMVGGYFTDKDRIPPGNLVDVRYEDLEQQPLQEMERIYKTLGLPGFAETRSRAAAYLEKLGTYKKNKFTLSRQDIDRVNTHWRFALDAWGYDEPAEADQEACAQDACAQRACAG